MPVYLAARSMCSRTFCLTPFMSSLMTRLVSISTTAHFCKWVSVQMPAGRAAVLAILTSMIGDSFNILALIL